MTHHLTRPLMRLSFICSILLLLTMIACRAEGPQDKSEAPTIQSPSLVPQEIPMTTLLRNPATFEGQTIRVTGQYRSLPLLVCGSTTHRSPATWTLIFGDIKTFVEGFDDALRPLAASGLSLTIEGRWQQWEGPVGCGRRAPSEEIWYLSASRIVSPNPLVKIDSDEDGGVVLLPTPTEIIESGATEIANITPVGQPSPSTNNPTPTSSGNNNPPPTPTFQLIPTGLPNPTDTPRPSPTSTITPTITAGGTVTATTTPTSTGTTADQGTLSFDTVEIQTLTADSPHIWQFNPPADEPLIITAGSSLNLNLRLDLIDPDGSIVETANLTGAGEPETILFTVPNPTGEFQIIVSDETGTRGSYILMLFNSESEPRIAIQETLVYGSGGSGNVPTGVDHFWNFDGQQGDIISIEVSPTGASGDLIFYLIGPDGGELEFIDGTGVGESENLTDFTLPESGFYSIGIGELEFGEVDYSLTLIQ